MLPSMYVNYGWDLKKSFTLLEDNVRIAKVLVLSKSTSLIGGGTDNSGFVAPMTVLKYRNNSYEVILKGRLVQISLSGWCSASEKRVFSSEVNYFTWWSSEFLAYYLILSSSISLVCSFFLFFFFFFFLSFSTNVPSSMSRITSSLTSCWPLYYVKSISYNLLYIIIYT